MKNSKNNASDSATGTQPAQQKKKRKWPKALLIVLIVLLILPFPLTVVLYESYFGHRADDVRENGLTEADFPGLSSTELTFPSGKNDLTGYLYYKDNTETIKGMVIVCHGIWSRHENMLEEISFFVENDYLVFAYDNTGTGESEGKSIIGLVQSQLDLDAALTFIEGEDSFKMVPKLLYGHSWGAYAVTSVLNNDHDVAAVAAMAPFNQSIDMLLETGSAMYGDAIRLLKPYLLLYERIKFGSPAGNTALSGINSTDIPVLVFHSDDDPTISVESSVYAQKDSYTNPNAHAYLIPDRGHTPFLSDEAVAYRRIWDDDEADHTGEAFDKDLYYELDANVMQQVLDVFDAAATDSFGASITTIRSTVSASEAFIDLS